MSQGGLWIPSAPGAIAQRRSLSNPVLPLSRPNLIGRRATYISGGFDILYCFVLIYPAHVKNFPSRHTYQHNAPDRKLWSWYSLPLRVGNAAARLRNWEYTITTIDPIRHFAAGYLRSTQPLPVHNHGGLRYPCIR